MQNHYEFAEIKAGERLCLCAMRWVEAYHANKASKLVLEATHESMLELVPLEVHKEFAAVEN